MGCTAEHAVVVNEQLEEEDSSDEEAGLLVNDKHVERYHEMLSSTRKHSSYTENVTAHMGITLTSSLEIPL